MTLAYLAVLLCLAAKAVFWYRSLLPTGDFSADNKNSTATAFLGDSITIGTALQRETEAYPELVGKRLHVQVRNLAIGGITQPEALEREVRRMPSDTSSVVVYLGTNDLWHTFALHTVGPFHDQLMRTSYLLMLHIIRTRHMKAYVVLLRDLSQMHRIRSGRAAAISHWTASWDDWASKQGAIPIDLRCFKDSDDPANYFPDEIHPNLIGNALLADHVAQGIREGGVTCGISLVRGTSAQRINARTVSSFAVAKRSSRPGLY